MIPVSLAKIKTSDGLTLEGIVVEPKRKSGAALIWLHGLGSRFSSGQVVIRELSRACRKAGIGYFKFNTRGHDIAARSDSGMIGPAVLKTYSPTIPPPPNGKSFQQQQSRSR